ITTKENIATFRRQLESLGYGYDWSRAVNTSDPGYFKWTQWIFLKLYNSYFDSRENKAQPIEKLVRYIESKGTSNIPCSIPRGSKQFSRDEWRSASQKEREDYLALARLAYISDAPVNWCPELGTVLANEEVAEQEAKGFT